MQTHANMWVGDYLSRDEHKQSLTISLHVGGSFFLQVVADVFSVQFQNSVFTHSTQHYGLIGHHNV